jgi:hypothetical protein
MLKCLHFTDIHEVVHPKLGYFTPENNDELSSFALWPAFPTSDYYDTTDAAQVSLPDCWEHLFQGSLPRS